MKLRGLLIAVVVLLVLGGLLYWSNHHKPSEEPAPSSTNASPAILKFDSASVAQVSLTQKGAAPVTLAKGSGDRWQITAPQVYPADQDAVSGLLASLSDLNADRVVEDKASDLKPYGLDDPSVTLDVSLKDGKEQKLLLGDDTPAGGDAYAMLAGDPRIFAIAGYNKTSIDKGLDDLRDKKVFDFGLETPSRIELHAAGKSWLLTHSSNDWWSSGKKMDGAAVDALVEKLRGLTATSFPVSGFSAPDIEATVTSSDGKQTEKVLISKSGIAKRDDEPTLYQLDSSAVTDLTSAANTLKPAAPSAK
jgi:hypothetical protein